MIRFIIIFFLSSFFLFFLLYLFLEFLIEDPQSLHPEYIFPAFIIAPLIVFYVGIKKYTIFENIILDKDKIISPKFGLIPFEEIEKYNIVEFLGTNSLFLTMRNQRKFSISPSKGGFTNFTQKQYDEFLKEFLRKIEDFNNGIDYLSKVRIKKEVSQIEKVSAIFILIIVIAIDLYILYNFINGDGFFPIQLLFLNFMLIYSIHILRNK